MRIFDAIQYQDKRVLSALACQQVFQVAILLFRGHRDHALMIGGLSHSRELIARHGAHWDSSGAAELGDLLDADITAARSNCHVFKAAAARGQGFLHCVDAKNDLHVKRSCPHSLLPQCCRNLEREASTEQATACPSFWLLNS